MRLVEVGVDGIRDIRNDVSAEKGTFLGSFFQPMTTGNEIDVASFVQFLLFKKYTVGEIFLSASVMDKRAMMALFFVMHASAGVVADAGAWHISCMVQTTGLPEARIFSMFFKESIPWLIQ